MWIVKLVLCQLAPLCEGWACDETVNRYCRLECFDRVQPSLHAVLACSVHSSMCQYPCSARRGTQTLLQGDVTHLMPNTGGITLHVLKIYPQSGYRCVAVQYKVLFDIIKSRSARKGLVGSGSYTFFHQSKVRSAR